MQPTDQGLLDFCFQALLDDHCVAPKGTGKASLRSILAGKDSSDSGGRVMFLKDIRIAFLEQDYDFSPGLSILEQVLDHSRCGLVS